VEPRDKFGRPIYPHVYAKMKQYGEDLLRAGYREAAKKPNLFHFWAGPVVFFADMRGTMMVPIWEDMTPLLYWSFRTSLPLRARQICVYIEWRRLLALGVHPRLSFECNPGDNEEDWQEAKLASVWDHEQANPAGIGPSGLRFLERAVYSAQATQPGQPNLVNPTQRTQPNQGH